MPDDTTASFAPTDDGISTNLPFASGALILAGVPFFIGGAIVIRIEVPPSSSPLLGMLSHTLFALGIAILTLGVVALLRWVETLRTGLAGYLATGILGLGVLQSLQWATWAYVDVRASRTGEYDQVLEALIVPFGAGHLLMYCILTGSGIALLGWALRRTKITQQYVDWAGIVLGALTFGTAVISLVGAFGGGSDGHAVFDIATLFLPVLYLWAMGLGISVYRHG